MKTASLGPLSPKFCISAVTFLFLIAQKETHNTYTTCILEDLYYQKNLFVFELGEQGQSAIKMSSSQKLVSTWS